MNHTSTLALAAYLFGAFLTFGHTYNNYVCAYPDQRAFCNQQGQLSSAVKGALWPIYWAGRAGIEVTKP